MFDLSAVTSKSCLKLRPTLAEIVPESCGVSPRSSAESFGKLLSAGSNCLEVVLKPFPGTFALAFSRVSVERLCQLILHWLRSSSDAAGIVMPRV